MSNINGESNLNVNAGIEGKASSNFFVKAFEVIKSVRELNLILIILVISIIMSFASPYFLKWSNIEAILLSFSTEGIVVIGMTFMLIGGGIDIAVGSTMCLAMVIPGALFLNYGINPWFGSLISLAISALVGFI